MNATSQTSRKWLYRMGRLLHAARTASGSLRVKIGLSVLAASAAGFTLLALFFGITFERETREIVTNQQRTIARNVASDTGQKIALARDALTELAQRLPLDRLDDAAAMQALMRDDGALFALLDDLVLLGADGVVIADWPVAPRRRGTDRSQAEHFQSVMAGGEARLSRPFIGPLLQVPVVILSVPVLDASRRVAAVISGIIRLNRPNFIGDLATRKIGSTGYFMLVDAEGTVMIDARPDRVMSKVNEDAAGAAIAALRGGASRLHESPRGGIYTASEVPGTGWVLVAVLPREEAYHSLASMQWTLGAIFALLLAATGVLIWPLVGRLLAPLAALRAATQALAPDAASSAQLDLSGVPRGTTEIDALADAFRRAVDRAETAKALLRAEHAFVDAVIENAGALVVVLDREGRIRRFNRACEELSGYRPAEVEGKFPWHTVLPPEDAATIRQEAFEALARNPQALSGRYTNHWVTKAREKRLIEWFNTVLLDAAGEMEYMVSIGVDVTETRMAQAALARRETQMRLLMDNVPALIAHYDAGERLLYSNRNYRDFYGIEPSGATGRTVAEVLGTENYAVASKQFQGVLKGETVAYVGRRLAQDGTERYVDACAVPERGPQSEVRGFFWLALDITSRRRAEQAGRESEARLKEAQRIAHVGSWGLDLVSNRLDWSDEIYRIFEIDAARFGASYEAFLATIHPDDRDTVNRAYADSVAKCTPYEIAHRLRMADGRIKWVRERCETFYDAAGKPLRSVGTVQDITAQAEIEQKLRESESRLRTILDTEPECVKLLDRGGNLLDMNPAGLSMIEADSIEQVRGHCVCPIVSEADRAAFDDMIAAVFHGESRTLEFQIHGLKGTLRHLETHAVPLWDGRREHVTALLGVTRDVSVRKAAEDEVRRLNAELEQRVAARTAELSAALAELEAFSYTISHDLRAPARAVAGFSQILLQDYGHQLAPGAHALLGRVSAAGRTMGEMIDGLLDLARIARTDIQRRPVDLSRLAAEVWSEVTMAERERSVKLELQPELAADADPILLRTVLQNLLGNAFKYTRDTVDARVAFGRTQHDGETPFFVRDNGAGLDMQYAAKLFGAFQRMHSAAEFEGTGIGLATVKRIVERHGGRIWAESRPGRGATFYFTLAPQGAAA